MSGEQLERRYRGFLRILPKPYRAAREEELLSALMDGAAEGRRWPELRETLSLARLGMRVRLGSAVGVVAYRSAVWPVALAVVSVATLVPVFIRAAAWPIYGGGDLVPLASLACAMVLVAGLAVLKEWRAGRSERSERSERPVPTS